jgi:hypothetical protein
VWPLTFPVPSRFYTIWLNPSTYVVVDFQSLEGEILAFVVRLVHVVGDEHRNVARYDTARGRPHRDLLSRRGRLLRKDWLEQVEFNRALTYAINDFKANHQTYIEKQD